MTGRSLPQETGRLRLSRDYHCSMHLDSEPFVDSRDFSRIAGAIRYIEEHFHQQPRLATIAAHVGLSEFHFNRLFRRWAGVTPKQYLAFVTGNAAQGALQTRHSVLDAAYSVGLSGPGRLHDLIVTLHAMTPGELKGGGLGTRIRHGFSQTPFGMASIASTARGICHLAFVDCGEEQSVLNALRLRWERAHFESDDALAARIARQIWGRTGRRRTELALSVGGTNFQLQIWQALLTLGARSRTTYAQLAQSVGLARGMRAVGGAVGANPVAWLIPCHNVLRQNGTLGGYHWGEDRKRAMLAWQALTSRPEYVTSKARAAELSTIA